MNVLSLFGAALAAAFFGGLSAGLLGLLLLGLRLPLLAIAAAHSALAGAVFAHLLGLDSRLGGFVGAGLGAGLLYLLLRRREVDSGAALGWLFSLTLGLAFLGIGLEKGPRSASLGLMWGNLLFTTPGQVVFIAAVAGMMVLFVILAARPLKLLLFSRPLAMLVLPEGLLFGGLLLLASGVITINLEICGGLLLYSLLSNPAVAALALARSYRQALLWSGGLGAASALGGFGLAFALDLPTGASIVIFSSILACGALLAARR